MTQYKEEWETDTEHDNTINFLGPISSYVG